MREPAGNRTVLIIDDEPQVIVALTDLLEDEFRVVTATTAPAALRVVETDASISVVLCDQRMPKMTGDQVLARTREVSTATRLLITGYADLQAVVRAVNEGKIFGYISKPWDPDALRIMVHKAVEYHDLNRELEHERALLHNLMAHSPDGILFKGRDHRYHRLNAAAARMLGVARPEDAIGKRPEDLLPEQRAALRVEVDSRIIATGEPVLDIEERVAQAGGGIAWYSASVAPVRNARREIVSLIAIMRDITARKEMESQLRQAQKMEAVGHLTGGVAHDFNNILGAVIGNLDLLCERIPDDEESRVLADAALTAALHGAELTKRLLAFARRQDLKPERLDLGERLGDLLKLLRRAIDGNVEIQARVEPGIWPIEVDPAQLEAAIVNLAVNARDAMPEGGSLSIEADNATIDDTHLAVQPEVPPGDYLRISVSDTGTGVAPEILERVFEPFFTTKPVGKGTGLGLSMVHGFTKQSNGHVTIYSALGRGTTIRLYLPRLQAEAAPARHRAADDALPLGGGECILVVEDNSPMRSVVSQLLFGLGYRPVEAGTAAEALAMLDSGVEADLVFSDVVMPGSMTGFDLADAMRARSKPIPVVLSSGFTERAGPLQSRRPPGAPELPLLNKPYRREDLARAIRGALDGEPGDGGRT